MRRPAANRRGNVTVTLRLVREITSDQGTFGKMAGPGLFVYTMERPWRNNEPNVSCIPAGKYELRPRDYNRGGYPAVEVFAVPGRTHILAHIGNTIDDVQGCICPGLGYGVVHGQWAVTSSKAAFAELMRKFDEWMDLGCVVYLEITDNFIKEKRADPTITA